MENTGGPPRCESPVGRGGNDSLECGRRRVIRVGRHRLITTAALLTRGYGVVAVLDDRRVRTRRRSRAVVGGACHTKQVLLPYPVMSGRTHRLAIMGKKIIEQIVDDLDGTVLASGEGETVAFQFDGRAYEIDLTTAHAAELRDALTPYIDAARPAGRSGMPRRRARRVTSAQRSGYPLAAIREWARKNGHDVPSRGRVPNAVIDAYNAAH